MSAAVTAPGPSQDVRPVRRALVSVYDKTGLEDLVRGLHDAGVALVSTGGSAALIESLGLPVTRVEDLTGFPECLEGRVKTLHPRVHAGILADTRKPDHVAQLADLGVEAVRARRRQPLPVRRHRRLGRQPRRVRRADRHRRPLDGPRGRQEPPERRRRHRPGGLRRGAGCRARRRLHPRAAQAARGPGLRAHRDLRRARGVVDGQRLHRQQRRHRLPRLGRRDVGPGGRAPLRREPAPARRPLHQRVPAAAGPRAGPAAARQGDVLQQLRRRRRRRARRPRPRRPADRGRHQARQPVRHRRGRRRRRRPPQGARVRPGLGLRRHHRDQPPGHRRDGPHRRRHLHRGRRRARVRRRRPRGAHREEEHPAPRVRRRRAAAAPRSARSAAACSCSTGMPSTPSSRARTAR